MRMFLWNMIAEKPAKLCLNYPIRHWHDRISRSIWSLAGPNAGSKFHTISYDLIRSEVSTILFCGPQTSYYNGVVLYIRVIPGIKKGWAIWPLLYWKQWAILKMYGSLQNTLSDSKNWHAPLGPHAGKPMRHSEHGRAYGARRTSENNPGIYIYNILWYICFICNKWHKVPVRVCFLRNIRYKSRKFKKVTGPIGPVSLRFYGKLLARSDKALAPRHRACCFVIPCVQIIKAVSTTFPNFGWLSPNFAKNN